jgi:hypothetical protein
VGLTRATAVFVVAALAGAAHADENAWPRAAIDRPLTLDRGLVEADLDATAAQWRVLGLRLDDSLLVLGARWGAGERLELDGATSFGVTPDAEWSGLVRVGAAWRAVQSPALDVAAAARLDGCGACGFSIFSTASLGAPLRWRLSSRFYLHAGRELLPWTIRPYLALDLSIRTGGGVQLTRWLAAEIDAEVARVTLVGQTRDDRWLAHAPVALSALASVAPRVDVGVSVATTQTFTPQNGWSVVILVAGRNR